MRHIRYYILMWSMLSLLLLMLASCSANISPSNDTATQRSTQTKARQITLTPQNTPTRAITPTPTAQQSGIQHIFYIMMENHATNQIIGNTADAPYLNSLASSYGVATQYYGITHPSLPNYLAAISGSFQGIWDDCPAGVSVTCAPEAFTSSLTSGEYASASNQPHMFNGQTIVDQLEAHHLTWKAYMQSMPSAGYTGDSYAGLYAQKHDPFMYFASIRNNPARMQQIVPFSQFGQDMQSNTVPNFVWISPDVCNDMHGAPSCSSYDGLIATGDSFVRSTVQIIMHSTAWKAGAAIVITWDENDGGSGGCCKSPTGANGAILGGADVPLIVVTSQGPHHIVLSAMTYNHYSLLATIEHIWNLGCIANTCGMGGSSLLTPLFTG